MESFKNILFAGLRNFEEHQVNYLILKFKWILEFKIKILFKVCQASVGVVGDLARNVGDKISPFCDDIMTILLEGLIVSFLSKSLIKIFLFIDR